MRSRKLKNIKKVRRLRDELCGTKNTGRAKVLLLKLPNLTGYKIGPYDSYYGSGASITITLKGGYDYYFGGYERIIFYIKEAGLHAYMKWINPPK